VFAAENCLAELAWVGGIWGNLDREIYPRFSIELTKSTGYLAKPFSTSAGRFASRRAATKSRFGIEYTVGCPYCSKRFKCLPMTRSSMSTKISTGTAVMEGLNISFRWRPS
jgi:hypothetical protein